MISVQFSFPNVYGLDEFTVGSHWVPGVGDRVNVYDEYFEVMGIDWVVSYNKRYFGGVIVHLVRRGKDEGV